MDYRDQVFLTVAEKLSFSKAADDLHISQPAVTKHIKELESRYNTNLFERKGNKISLTQAGQLAYTHLKTIARQYRDLEFEIGSISNHLSGEFIIGASSTIAQYLIPKVIASFHRRHPKIRIQLINGNSFEMEQLLVQNKIDMALVENSTSKSDIRYKSFLNDELIWVTGAHSVYAHRKSIRLDELTHIPLVLREPGSGTLEVIKKALEKQGIDFTRLNSPVHLGSTESIKNFLLDYDGVAIISEKSVVTELYMKSLIRLTVDSLNLPRTFRIALRQGYESRQVELFENFLLSYNF